jgi:galactokinase/mevalonate kinase-like predicted kinase
VKKLERRNLDSFGEILHENWGLKKSLAAEISIIGMPLRVITALLAANS